MPNAIVIHHVVFEDLGTLQEELTRAEFSIEYVDACSDDLSLIDPLQPDLLVVLGGPVGVYEQEAYPFINNEVELIRQRLEAKRPTLGICLGAQLMAAAMGANVYPGSRGKEIGWAAIQAGPDIESNHAMMNLFEPGLRVLHWHGDTFDLPLGTQHLASTSTYRNQAFAIGHYGLGLQFHPEVTVAGLERWYVGHACELVHAGIDVRTLREDGKCYAPELEIAARHFWRDWIRTVIANL